MIARIRLKISRFIYASARYRSLEAKYDCLKLDLADVTERFAGDLRRLAELQNAEMLARTVAEGERDRAREERFEADRRISELQKEIAALRVQLPERRSDGVFAPRPGSRRSKARRA